MDWATFNELTFERRRRVRARHHWRELQALRSACHESGHAVCCAALGGTPAVVGIDSVHGANNFIRHARFANPLNEVWTCVAGGVAEGLALGDVDEEGIRNDIRNAEFAAFEHFGGMCVAMKFVEKQWAKVESLLIGHWSKVARLALALVEQRDAAGVCELNHREVRAIVGSF